MLCRFCFSKRNFGCFDLACLIVSGTCVIFLIGITVICNIICSWMGHIYAATPGQNPGVARIYMIHTYIYIIMNIKILKMSCQLLLQLYGFSQRYFTSYGVTVRHDFLAPVPQFQRLHESSWIHMNPYESIWIHMNPLQETYRNIDSSWTSQGNSKTWISTPEAASRRWFSDLLGRSSSSG